MIEGFLAPKNDSISYIGAMFPSRFQCELFLLPPSIHQFSANHFKSIIITLMAGKVTYLCGDPNHQHLKKADAEACKKKAYRKKKEIQRAEEKIKI